MTLSFEADIRQMFTAMDRDHMLNQVGMFDLWSYGDVKTHAEAIYKAVKGATMPPPGGTEAPWAQSQVNTFKAWMDGGCEP